MSDKVCQMLYSFFLVFFYNKTGNEFFSCAVLRSYFLFCQSMTALQPGDTLKASAAAAYAQNIRSDHSLKVV